MNSALPFLTAAAFAAIGLAPAADTPPPPPPPPAESSGTSRPASGRDGLMEGAHRPFAALIKEIEEKGKITKEEFLDHSKKQAEEGFARLDKNHDGVIDKSEIAEIEGKMKGLREKMQERGRGKGKAGSDGPRKRPGADEKSNAAKPATDGTKPAA